MKKNGAIASDLWMEALQTLTNAQIKLGIDRCKEKIFSGNAWPPDLGEFLSMIHGQTDVDYHAAFLRCLAKTPEGRIEQWVHEKAGYNIRVSTHEAAERMHKKFMKEAIEKDKRGELKLNDDMLKALPVNSVKNLNDIKQEEWLEKNGKGLNPRIDKIIKG